MILRNIFGINRTEPPAIARYWTRLRQFTAYSKTALSGGTYFTHL